ncbi:hypothetical protein ACPYOC_12465 [Ornithinimicrobium sp. W1665]
MAQYLGLASHAGLTNLLIGDAEYEDVLQSFADAKLTVLGSGPIPPNPSELLGSPALRSYYRDSYWPDPVADPDAPRSSRRKKERMASRQGLLPSRRSQL